MMEPSFEKLLVLLAEAAVGFIVGGGIAASIQGYVRLTEQCQIAIASKNSLIEWKSVSVREKDRIDADALPRLQENPRAFD